MRYKHSRIIAAILTGSVATLIYTNFSSPIAESAFIKEESWDGLLWGGHYVFRFIICFSIVFGSAFIAGLIARRRGKIIGVTVVIPTVFFIIFIISVLYNESSAENLWVFIKDMGFIDMGVLFLWTILIFPVASYAGNLGSEIGNEEGPNFDKKSLSICGIKFYHYLWLLPVFHIWYATILWEMGWLLKIIVMLRKYNINLFKFSLPSLKVIVLGVGNIIVLGSIIIAFLSFISGVSILMHYENNKTNVKRALVACLLIPIGVEVAFTVILNFVLIPFLY
ncbi:MAG: hypothetical protein HYT75_06310 [Deltaproteobacteria bacterium]|nr:hypothetical protein [Deltaproteobacteria bacterium]